MSAITPEEIAALKTLAETARKAFLVWKANPKPAAWKVASVAEQEFRDGIDPDEFLALLSELEAARRERDEARGDWKDVPPHNRLISIAEWQRIVIERDASIGRIMDKLAAARAEVDAIAAMVDAQAEDGGLWFDAQTAPEGYLQQELRKLHAAVAAARTRWEKK